MIQFISSQLQLPDQQITLTADNSIELSEMPKYLDSKPIKLANQ